MTSVSVSHVYTTVNVSLCLQEDYDECLSVSVSRVYTTVNVPLCLQEDYDECLS